MKIEDTMKSHQHDPSRTPITETVTITSEHAGELCVRVSSAPDDGHEFAHDDDFNVTIKNQRLDCNLVGDVVTYQFGTDPSVELSAGEEGTVSKTTVGSETLTIDFERCFLPVDPADPATRGPLTRVTLTLTKKGRI